MYIPTKYDSALQFTGRFLSREDATPLLLLLLPPLPRVLRVCILALHRSVIEDDSRCVHVRVCLSVPFSSKQKDEFEIVYYKPTTVNQWVSIIGRQSQS